MQIKVSNTDGDTKVEVITPAAEEGAESVVCSEVGVGDGEEVTVTIPGASSESDIEVGSPVVSEKPEGS